MKLQTNPEYQYLNLLKDIIKNGQKKNVHNVAVSTRNVFGRQIRFDLSKGFPLLTTKKVFFRGILHELLWFIRGDSNIKYLVDNGVHIWDEWGYKKYLEKIVKNKQKPLSVEEYLEKINSAQEYSDVADIDPFNSLGLVLGRSAYNPRFL